MSFTIRTFLGFLFVSIVFSANCQVDTTILPIGKDAWIWSFPSGRDINFGEENSSNGGLHNVIRAETWQWQQGRVDTIRSAIYVDIPDSLENYSLNTGYLVFHAFQNPNFQPNQGNSSVVFHPITSEWHEDKITWNNMPAYDETYSRKHRVIEHEGKFYIEIYDLIYYERKNEVFGWIMMLQDESGNSNVLSFASSELSEDSLKPYLLIYTDSPSSPTGIEFAKPPPPIPTPVNNQFKMDNTHLRADRAYVKDANNNYIEVPYTVSKQEVVIDTESLPKGIYDMFICLSDVCYVNKFEIK
jgi:hypothetical protein